MGRQHDPVRAGLDELALRRGDLAACDDGEVLVEAPGAQRDEDVGGIVGQHRGEGPGARDPGELQHVLIGRIPLERQKTERPRRGKAALAAVHHHEGAGASLEIEREALADPPVAADDDVAAQLVDVSLHAPDPEERLELADRDELDQATGEEDHAGAAGHDERDRDGPQRRRVDRPDLVETHGIDREHHHVDGIPDAPPVPDIGEGRGHRDGEHEQDAGQDVAERGREDLQHRGARSTASSQHKLSRTPAM